ncbi:MAG: 16S rRNA (uracil(1498)-N(3))-methyltransferase [Clostridia bacterium]|nr:16S rRNA (uracil(1498)-N(3))-methyltransferase [Clostridia bacterium]
MYKFFVKNHQRIEDTIQIENEDVNHIKNVLRLRKGEEIEVCNMDTNITYLTRIVTLEENKVMVNILTQYNKTTESNVLIHLFQGLPKQEKMEQVIQKVTEIGVSEITPVKMERCIVKLDEKTEKKKIERWQKIAEVAAKQSKRDKIPKLHSCIELKNIYKDLQEYDIVIVAYEEENNITIKQVLQSLAPKKEYRIAAIIGPEGGIATKEIQFLKNNSNTKIVTLGKRILRTETAPVVLSSVIMYELEEME